MEKKRRNQGGSPENLNLIEAGEVRIGDVLVFNPPRQFHDKLREEELTPGEAYSIRDFNYYSEHFTSPSLKCSVIMNLPIFKIEDQKTVSYRLFKYQEPRKK